MRISKTICNYGVFITLGVTLFILMVTLLALTVLKQVNQSDYAVEYNAYTCNFDRVLEQGKYTTDVGVMFFVFQRTLQNLVVGEINSGSLQCITSDKVLITLDIAIQIQYVRNSLIPIILKQFNNDANYKIFLIGMAESTILNTCTLYTAEQYYLQRSMIDIAMLKNLKNVINATIGTTVEFFQLTDIQFPNDYSSIILQKQTTQQLETTYLNDRQNQLTNANTNYFVANNTANIMLIHANQQVETVINKANTNRNFALSFWQQRADTYAALLVDNFDNNITKLMEYIKSETMRNTGTLYSSV